MTVPDYMIRADTGPFDGDESRELVERAYLLEQLTETEGWAELVRVVTAELGKWERVILNGRMEPDAYRHQTGYVRGLRAVLDTPHTAQQQALEAESRRPSEENT